MDPTGIAAICRADAVTDPEGSAPQGRTPAAPACEEASTRIMVVQLPEAPALGTSAPVGTTLPWLNTPQLKPADCVPEESVGAYNLLRRYGVSAPRQQRIPRDYFTMPGPERDEKIWALKRQLGEQLVILGHHYQRDEVIQFADFR